MKTAFKCLAILIAVILVLSGAASAAESIGDAPLVLQDLDYTENPIDIPNPDRGFYRANDGNIVPVSGGAGGGSANSSVVTISGAAINPRIAHMYFDLRNFSSQAGGTTQPLTEPALSYIRATLQKVRAGEGVAILRFVYHQTDTYNRTNGPEPTGNCTVAGHTDKNWIQYHIFQLKPIFQEYEDIIMCVDGGFFGCWGEMHTTAYSKTAANYVWLLDALLDAVPESRSILVHAGGFLAWYNAKHGTAYNFTSMNTLPAPARGAPEQRFGMFNDSYANDVTDNGSLSEGTGLVGGSYSRDRVLNWVRNQNNFYGGETNDGTSDTSYTRFPNVAYEAPIAHTSHLNTDWYSGRLNLWGSFVYNEANVTISLSNQAGARAVFDPVYDGKNGIEFFRDRLGYRLVLREAKASEWVAQNGVLRFEGKIQNVGFGNIVNRKNVAVILKPKTGSGSYTALTGLDARDWLCDLDSRASNTAAYRDLNFSLNMGAFGDVPAGGYDIYLKINDPQEMSANKRCIRLANKGNNIWDAATGANLIGSTTVTPVQEAFSFSGAILYQPSSHQATVTLHNNKDNYTISTKTAANGAFTLTLPAPPQQGALYTLVITKPGYLSYTLNNLTWAELAGIDKIDIQPIAGDVNGDGVVNAVDLAQLLSEFNRGPLVFLAADIDGNGIVNATDLTYLLAGFNKRNVVEN